MHDYSYRLRVFLYTGVTFEDAVPFSGAVLDSLLAQSHRTKISRDSLLQSQQINQMKPISIIARPSMSPVKNKKILGLLVNDVSIFASDFPGASSGADFVSFKFQTLNVRHILNTFAFLTYALLLLCSAFSN